MDGHASSREYVCYLLLLDATARIGTHEPTETIGDRKLEHLDLHVRKSVSH